MQIADFGQVLDSLKTYIRPWAQEAHDNYYSTVDYYRERALAVHRGFQAWCQSQSIAKDSMPCTLKALKEHCSRYPCLSNTNLSVLFTTLPVEFNQHGYWEPE